MLRFFLDKKCTTSIPDGNAYCSLKRSAKGFGLKSHLKDYHQKLTTRSSVQIITKPDILLVLSLIKLHLNSTINEKRIAIEC